MARLFSSTSVETTLASGINSSVTSMTVAAGTGSSLTNGVTIGTGNQFTVAIDPDTSNEEIVFITVQSTDTFTIERGKAGTSQVSHSAGATVRHVLTSDDLNYFNGAVPAAIVDAKGDLIVATAADTVSRLAVGTNNTRLVADSAQATGLKYVADTQNTVIDAEGDLLVGDAADLVQRLAIGTNNQVLTVDTTVDGKVKWAATQIPTFVGASMYKSTTQSTTSGTAVAITFDTEDFDTNAFHSTSTNTSRVTIPAGYDGKYRISGVVTYAATNSTLARAVLLYKNGTLFNQMARIPGIGSITTDTAVPFSFILNLVAGDYIELFALQNTTVSVNLQAGQDDTTFQVQFLGA